MQIPPVSQIEAESLKFANRQKPETYTSSELSLQSQDSNRSYTYEKVVRFFGQHEIELNAPLTRASFAVLIDYYLDPFYSNSVRIGFGNSRL